MAIVSFGLFNRTAVFESLTFRVLIAYFTPVRLGHSFRTPAAECLSRGPIFSRFRVIGRGRSKRRDVRIAGSTYRAAAAAAMMTCHRHKRDDVARADGCTRRVIAGTDRCVGARVQSIRRVRVGGPDPPRAPRAGSCSPFRSSAKINKYGRRPRGAGGGGGGPRSSGRRAIRAHAKRPAGRHEKSEVRASSPDEPPGVPGAAYTRS